MTHRFLLGRAASAIVTVLLSFGVGGASCLDNLPFLSSPCEEACELEDLCGLRTFDTCMAASCGDAGRLGGGADDCMLAVVESAESADAGFDCTEIIFCTCDDSCAATETCTGSSDPGCGGTCETLVEQAPEAAYRENRCRIESSCEDLALCTGV